MPPELPQRSKKLVRQIKKYLGDEQAEAQFRIIAEYLSGIDDPDLSVKAARGIPAFMSAVEAAYAEYEDRIKTTLRSLDISSEELNTTNRTLERLNSSINAMMDGLGQGLVFFDRDGICSPVFSKISTELLDDMQGGVHIADILNLDSAQRENFDLWVSILFEKTSALSFEDLADLAPDHFINAAGRYIHLDYRPLRNAAGDMTGVLLIATDKTRERQVENDLAETQRKSAMIVSIARNRNSFLGFVRNLKSFIIQVTAGEEARCIEILRELHTYKGLAYMFHLDTLGDAMNTAEDEMKIAPGSTVDIAGIKTVLAPIQSGLDDALEMGKMLFGADFINHGNVRLIEMDKILQLRADIAKSGDPQAVIEFINHDFLGVTFSECLSTFCAELMRAAGLKGRPEPQIHIHGAETRLMLNAYEVFFDSLVHLARNIMDHAIEDAATRKMRGKPPGGQIDISIVPRGAGWAIKIRDDGRGFDVLAIRSRAAELEVASANLSDREMIQYIFHPGFSTKLAATSLSGRGVGMYAIKKAVEDLGGAVSCEIPDKGPGAIISVILP